MIAVSTSASQTRIAWERVWRVLAGQVVWVAAQVGAGLALMSAAPHELLVLPLWAGAIAGLAVTWPRTSLAEGEAAPWSSCLDAPPARLAAGLVAYGSAALAAGLLCAAVLGTSAWGSQVHVLGFHGVLSTVSSASLAATLVEHRQAPRLPATTELRRLLPAALLAEVEVAASMARRLEGSPHADLAHALAVQVLRSQLRVADLEPLLTPSGPLQRELDAQVRLAREHAHDTLSVLAKLDQARALGDQAATTLASAEAQRQLHRARAAVEVAAL